MPKDRNLMFKVQDNKAPPRTIHASQPIAHPNL